MTGLPILMVLLLLGPPDRLDEAERDYRAGDYATALAGFDQALAARDGAAGPVLYNAGNCAFRLGRTADAVHYYRRALLRLPRDNAIQFNLQLAQEQLGIDAPVAPAWWTFRWLTGRELWWLALVLQAVGLGGLALRRSGRRARGALLLVTTLGVIAAGRTLQLRFLPGPPPAVVLSNEAALHDTPAADSPSTRLLAGELLQVEEAAAGWSRISGPHGSGWTESTNLGVID